MLAPLADRAPRRLRVRLELPRVSRPVAGRVHREASPTGPVPRPPWLVSREPPCHKLSQCALLEQGRGGRRDAELTRGHKWQCNREK